MEEWKDIIWYEWLYQVSNLWNVKNIKTNRILKPYNWSWYLKLSFLLDNKKKQYYVHRLVAQAFIKNIESKKFINHKDWNKTNNKLDNLEWCTASENINHYFKSLCKNGWIKNNRQKHNTWNTIKIFWTKNKEKIYFNSCREAERCWFNRRNIYLCIKWVNKTHKWYIWNYC